MEIATGDAHGWGKLLRSTVIGLVIGFVPDLIVAWLYMRYEEGGAWHFVGALVALQALYFVLWLKNIWWQWLAYWLWSRRSLARNIENYLSKNAFPAPELYQTDFHTYVSDLARDDMDVEVRVKSTEWMSFMEGVKAVGAYSFFFMLSSSGGLALKRFKKYATSPPEPTLEELGFE